MSHFKAIYGYEAPHLAFPPSVTTSVDSVEKYLKQRESILLLLKETLKKAQERMKHFVDAKRTDRSFEVGDLVYLKLHPYRQVSVSLRSIFKLSSKYYGPFPVIQKIGTLAYKLQLPPEARIHPMFHVSQLKKKIGVSHTLSPTLPVVDHEGQVIVTPIEVLDSTLLVRGNHSVPQLPIHWYNPTTDEATWEDSANISAHFPAFNP
ncbi:uncharacterized protein LOC113311991 [Papaver somniferum]|uniref:uncharacterized protein LOC113311991 n=1 Tax=Papaver somniferum TaxID=3469 RepID=UPI000E6FFD11|nr:uncharacterized protein LOC113311991 [Papaver somniferum]